MKKALSPSCHRRGVAAPLLGFRALLAITLFLPTQVASLAARASLDLEVLCPLACEHGGSCAASSVAVPSDSLGQPAVYREMWSCLCPPAWGGATCSLELPPLQEGADVSLAGLQALTDAETDAEPLLQGDTSGGLAAIADQATTAAEADAQPLLLQGDTSGGLTAAAGQAPASTAAATTTPAPAPAKAEAAASPAASGTSASGSDGAKTTSPNGAARGVPVKNVTDEVINATGLNDLARMNEKVRPVSRLELWSAFVVSVSVLGACLVFFIFARLWLPLVYQGAVEEVDTRFTLSGLLGWIPECARMPVDEITEEAGLDCGAHIAFVQLCFRLCATIGIPFLFIISPLHLSESGKELSDDAAFFSSFSLGRLSYERSWWVFWIHATLVWYVVIMVMNNVNTHQEWFLPRRSLWLKQLRYPRNNTVLVEDLPRERNSAKAVRALFDEEVFARPVVESLWMVKDTEELIREQAALEKLERAIKDYRVMGTNSGGPAGEMKPMPMFLGRQKEELEKKVEQIREHIYKDKKYNRNAAFVTFKRARDKVMVCKAYSEDDNEEIIVEPAPAPEDIRWADLQTDFELTKRRAFTGKIAIVVMFFFFLPAVVMVQGIARLEGLSPSNPLHAIEEDPALVVYWNGVMGALVLSILCGLMPLIFALIINKFFRVSSSSQVQSYLQTWHTAFLFIFVVVVTGVGGRLLHSTLHILLRPMLFIQMLVVTLPKFVTFYLTYLLVQSAIEGFALVRPFNLAKFLAFRPIYGEEEAKRKSEPEDQVLSGMGVRSARMTLLIALPIIFANLCPAIAVLALFNFGVCRIVYTYLFVFAETTKPDLGGKFWCQQLLMLQYATLFYIVMMGIELHTLTESWLCTGLAMSSLGFWFKRYKEFERFRWEVLAFRELEEDIEREGSDQTAAPQATNPYRQKELDFPPGAEPVEPKPVQQEVQRRQKKFCC